MKSKSLKASYTLTAATLDEAIAELSGLYVRATKAAARVVRQSTGFPLVNICKSLLDDWRNGKHPYQPGEITLSFGDELDLEADLLIYCPVEGDRLLYSRKTPRPLGQLTLPIEEDLVVQIAKQIRALSETLTQLTDHQRAIETRLQALMHQAPTPAAPSLSEPASATTQQVRSLLEAQTTLLSQMISQQVASQISAAVDPLIQPILQRLEAMQLQLEQLALQVELAEDPPAPQTEAEWLQRIQETWGTVGDYEQYSTSHRDANVETPLFHTPDWVALCELDWARNLSPMLAALYTFIHGPDGVGYSGADVLQQFGQHVDPRTGDRYYIYKLGGFSAAEALWQMVSHPQYSWLPELKKLSAIAPRYPDVFKLFGWEKEAIAGLEQVVKRAQQERGRQQTYSQQSQHSQNSQHYSATGARAGNSLSDHLAVLNIGPFVPINQETLKQAYRQAMKTAHPDAGGSKERAQRVNEAYEAVLRHYFPNAI
ncbi:hypothetical protein ACQ4M4_27470 [Leptolyngbya sp. AN02str]|uniref:hypothetical protein n=1 Tax=Leptolyngbya sp. AN02str TaxID=3423363 RepID=UPI003D322183